MTRRLTIGLAAICMTIGCVPDRPPPPEPPASSYEPRTYQIRLGETTAPVEGAAVTRDFFADGRMTPLLGRLFADGDFQPASEPVVVLSHALWEARLASAPTVIGRAIEVDGRRVRVVGIMPRGFAVPNAAQVWLPKR
jgi:hypothetical protein